MAENIDKIYEEAVSSGLLPGVSLLASDRDGNILYSKSLGRASLRAGDERPFTADTMCHIASMSKLVTAIAALQCVEDGTLSLDADARPLLPQMGRHGILTDWRDCESESEAEASDAGGDGGDGGIFEPLPASPSAPITLRMLLSHTSGHEYDWLSARLGRWRASRGEGPWPGPTVESKSTVPLSFAPGAGFAYGGGHDWAGRLVERASGRGRGGELEDVLRARVWEPLGVAGDVSFWPERHAGMRDRMAGHCTLEPLLQLQQEQGQQQQGQGVAAAASAYGGGDGAASSAASSAAAEAAAAAAAAAAYGDYSGPFRAVDAPDWDARFGGAECFGGGGLYASARGYHALLAAVLRRDPALLRHAASWDELFRPQLDGARERAFNDYATQSPMHEALLGLALPPGTRRTWSFAGCVAPDGVEGRCAPGAVAWAGVPTVMWFVDHEAGICGTAFCQILPVLHPAVMALHDKFQRGVFEIARARGK
ncbi:beta-lactamase/transpeptidase-like protein [Xylariaceae sp. FL0804]|nr:beta-lactamase/transpeptidase-like protein [Xylariaceae sp. FL0804]